ncbi:MAG: helix-turn-helix domain-containing protein [Chloroflexi bacterium]|nr:helix-turn-helix domain-containing protein [Chloroflexota bacterium]
MVEKLAYSAKEVAQMLGLSEWKVRELCYRGEIRSLKAGGRLLIPKAAVDEFLNPAHAIDPWGTHSEQ